VTDITYLSAGECARAIRAGALSPVDVMRATLARIERAQPILNAFITVTAERALAEAEEAARAVSAGASLGPLHGVPFSVKDLVATAGVRTTFGSLAFADNVPDADAVSVARLRAAGAILIGKTTTPEFGHKPFTEAPLFGRTVNAWDRSRTAGGSSGGAAVAVAAGLGPLALGTDGGGSGRIPAACNGVVGHKQTLGLVPHDGTPDAFGNLAYVNPIARTVADTALMLQAMAGPDGADPWSQGVRVDDYVGAVAGARDLAGVRIAWLPRLGNATVAADVLAAARTAVDAFAAMGARVEEPEVTLPNTEPDWMVITQAFWYARFWPLYERWGDRISDTLVRQMARAQDSTAADLERALFARTRIFRTVQSWFDDVDLLVMPTLSRTALAADHDLFAPVEIDGRTTDTVRKAWYPYTHPFNLTGHPACTVPSGFGRDGLPLAVQIVGRWHADAQVLAAAALLEQARPWASARPRLPELDPPPAAGGEAG